MIFNSNKRADIFVSLVFIFLIIQSLLMGLNREHGNDLNLFMHLSELFFAGSRVDSIYAGMISSLFSLFFFFPLSLLPTTLAHAFWYPFLTLAFLHSIKVYHKALFGSEIATSPLLFVFIIFVEIIQSNFLNGQMQIPVLALILYSLSALKQGSNNRAVVLLAFAISLKLEASLFLLYLLFSKRYLIFFKTIFLITLCTFFIPFMINGVGTTSFYSSFYGWMIGRVFDFSAMLYFVPFLFIIGIAFIALLSINLSIIKSGEKSLPTELLYFPLMPIVFHPLFSTHSLIFIFPPLFVISSHLWEERGRFWQVKSFYLLLLTVGTYHIARLLDEPRSGYLFAVVFLFITMFVYLKEKLEK